MELSWWEWALFRLAVLLITAPAVVVAVAGEIASLQGEAHAWLRSPNYDTLKPKLEIAHSAVEAATTKARRRVRLNEGEGR